MQSITCYRRYWIVTRSQEIRCEGNLGTIPFMLNHLGRQNGTACGSPQRFSIGDSMTCDTPTSHERLRREFQVIQAQVGHISAQMTQHYTHISTTANHDAATLIEQKSPSLLLHLADPDTPTAQEGGAR